jgi:hypothetical protein
MRGFASCNDFYRFALHRFVDWLHDAGLCRYRVFATIDDRARIYLYPDN